MMNLRGLLQQASFSVYADGYRLFEAGAVGDIAITVEIYCLAKVESRYIAKVNLDDTGSRFLCNCGRCGTSSPCSHVTALLFKLLEMQEGREAVEKIRPPRENSYVDGGGLFSLFRESETETDEPLRLQPLLNVVAKRYAQCSLELTIGTKKLYILRDIYDFVRARENGENYTLSSKMEVTPEMPFAPGLSQSLWQLVRNIYYDENRLTNARNWYFSQRLCFNKRQVCLTGGRLAELLGFFDEGDGLSVSLDGGRPFSCSFSDTVPPLKIFVSSCGGGALLRLEPPAAVCLTETASYILLDRTIYRPPEKWQEAAGRVFQAFADGPLRLERNRLGDFFSEVLPVMERAAEVLVEPALAEAYRRLPLVAEAYIDYWQDGVACRLVYRYGEQEINPALTADSPNGLVRDRRKEKRVGAVLEKYGFSLLDGRFVQPDEEKTYEFFTEGVPELSKLADVFYSDEFREKPVRKFPAVGIGVSVSEHNLLEVQFNMEEVDFQELVELLAAYRRKRSYYRLKNGCFMTLADRQLEGLAGLVEDSGLKENEDGTLTMPLSNALYLDRLAEEEGLELTGSRDYHRLVKSVASPELLNLPVPEEVNGVLRDYQLVGFNWLSTLAAYGLGGILADDMGLGKTLQVLVFILAHTSDRPALVVAPTSLMYNWLEEIRRFTPSLRAAALDGTRSERQARLAAAGDYDILVTTYGLLQRDIELYEKERFSWCFLDEAQYIKNPLTKNARAAKRLTTGGYFALTGTPIENNLTELWSIFDYLMPGYLGSHKKFQQHYEKPIVQGKDEKAAAGLRRRIAPFILRRLKKDVLSELPDKVETRLLAEMTPAQTKTYLAYFAQARKDFAKELAANGFVSSRVKILAILTRLRQVACDPALFIENYTGGSGKLDLLLEVVEQAHSGGHRMLIFSQFVTMLARIRARLEAAGIEYLYLDGQTPSAERLAITEAFNRGTVPVFLISLKAGGTGLNLTGADMVIHVDPWWNPAVEDQATDRAYRMGQNRKVQVIKLISRHTIEEKIYELQQTKKKLIDNMLQPDGRMITGLTEAEIRELFA